MFIKLVMLRVKYHFVILLCPAAHYDEHQWLLLHAFLIFQKCMDAEQLVHRPLNDLKGPVQVDVECPIQELSLELTCKYQVPRVALLDVRQQEVSRYSGLV